MHNSSQQLLFKKFFHEMGKYVLTQDFPRSSGTKEGPNLISWRALETTRGLGLLRQPHKNKTDFS